MESRGSRARRVFVGCFLVVGLACGAPARQAAWEATPAAEGVATGGEGGDVAASLTLGQEGWANRDEEAGLRQAIAGFQAAVDADPAQPEAWVMLARSHYLLADCHLSFDEMRTEEKQSEFEAGTQAAEFALVHGYPAFAERMRAGARIEETLDTLDAAAVPALYWRASSLGKWASADFATLLSYKDEIKAIMQTCLDLDSDYFHSGPSRYFGVFYGRAPGFAGGDLEQSKTFFDTSLSEAPNYFGTRVLMAQDYAVKAQDRALFEEQLNIVIQGDPEAGGLEIAPENRCEQRKAQVLLDKADELFE
ncbi:MAG: TRAP transporter TatT component family protein [Myxococcota bacterium]